MKLSISSGKFKGAQLNVPPGIKPVRSRVKLSVFSILDERMKDASCLDLFAGSGNLGLEAISRGAASCDFVDHNYDSIKAINENILNINRKYSGSINTSVHKSEAVKFIANVPEHYDIIFMDPPYDSHLNHCIKYIHELLEESGIIVFFHKKGFDNYINLNENLKLADSRNYGITQVDFLTLS